ncbi:SGNH/GDSL hydrolase family protein [Microbulbifer mangrovi]|uniref:SGNH/GDSL hydrolase family protein n=1 Tax=Microbulbifer mangrovi TaxID=927787 RepID=UPI0009908C1E|nr:SGNH/GDSL hydrolase family protein [Microbulbifer mangrovi]
MRHLGSKKFFTLIAFGLLLFFVFAAGKVSSYKMISEERLTPLGSIMASRVNSHPLVDQEKVKVSFLGDSRAKDWADYYQGSQDFNVINLGLDGQTTAQVLYRAGYHSADLDASVVVIQVGINDLKVIGFDRNLFREVVDNCKRNISSIVDLIEKNNGQIVISTIFPRGELNLVRRIVWSEHVDFAILEVNDYIRKNFEGRATIVDSYSILSSSVYEVDSKYSEDFLHINNHGYQVISLHEKLMQAAQKF